MAETTGLLAHRSHFGLVFDDFRKAVKLRFAERTAGTSRYRLRLDAS